MALLSQLALRLRNLARPSVKRHPGREPVAEAKSSAVGKLLGSSVESAFFPAQRPIWTGRSFEQLAREGYQKNAVAHRAVKIVSEGAAAVRLRLLRGDIQLGSHPLLDLLARPNPLQSGQALFESLYAYLQLAGNAYLEAAENLTGQPGELYALRPDRTKVVPGQKGWPLRFEYRVGGHVHSFPVDADSGDSSVLHLKFFNPLDDWYGLSPLEAAAFGIEPVKYIAFGGV